MMPFQTSTERVKILNSLRTAIALRNEYANLGFITSLSFVNVVCNSTSAFVGNLDELTNFWTGRMVSNVVLEELSRVLEKLKSE